ncbi:MAG: CGNR zinc finger domain-containing protein [Actinomycetota bacterium]|nr:CGNR zinc finger domain-containing protein [Actinomycetota bacterium]
MSLLALVAADGLSRLHGCAAEGCAGVFVDTTRNRSRRYCIPELCGNRTNLAAYRARRRAAKGSDMTRRVRLLTGLLPGLARAAVREMRAAGDVWARELGCDHPFVHLRPARRSGEGR